MAVIKTIISDRKHFALIKIKLFALRQEVPFQVLVLECKIRTKTVNYANILR